VRRCIVAIVFFCAHSERSALGLELALEKQMRNVKHLQGGYAAWVKSGRAVFRSK
jgi:rhodanese-related sulfurtransferase